MPATAQQLNFDFMLGAKRQFRIAEAADIIGMSPRYVEDCFDSGLLSGHCHNNGTGRRKSKTIPREWLAAYLVRTAQYDAPMRLQMAADIIDTFRGEDLLALRNHIDRRLAR